MKKNDRIKSFLLAGVFVFLLFPAFGNFSSYAAGGAEEIEEFMMLEKEIEKEKEKALIEHFFSEGKRLFQEGDYESAIDRFSRILEVEPDHTGAKAHMKLIRRKVNDRKKMERPEEMAKKLMRNGRVKYNNRDYEGALEDFQDAMVLDYSNEDILEWIKRANRRLRLHEAKREKHDLSVEAEVATKNKEVQEKIAMLEIEKSYLPPKKPERKPVEIEELYSPEEEAEERARQELMRKLEKKMVPAVSLTEADIRDVIRQLMEITGVTIVIDEGALAAAAGKEPLRITFSTVNPLPLLEVLNIVLRATDLDYRVEPNYIWISTPEKLEKENLITRTYRLRYGVRRVRKVELKEFETKSSDTE
ncbi:MAG: hypothetical protein ISS26_03320 [Candidatus Omnitrophica bacterium]|nr:hypothetical protein [Candidatus Omnitrophota bacterium]